MSTTGVYGDADGAWIDEETPPAPTSARGGRRLDAERQVARWGDAHGVPVVILRVAAIYGPGRLPRARSGRGDVPVNRIHVDDLATTCVAAADRGAAGRVYDCADGTPVTQDAFLETLARLGGPDLRGAPPVVNDFLDESKRIRARRIRDELGVALRYPDHEAGLRATLGATLHNGA
jgi:nucleoside-diphosphate-sugar epimerase